jgi:hypothetical protein
MSSLRSKPYAELYPMKRCGRFGRLPVFVLNSDARAARVLSTRRPDPSSAEGRESRPCEAAQRPAPQWVLVDTHRAPGA